LFFTEKKPLKYEFKVMQMILKIAVGSLLILSVVSAVAGNMYTYQDKGGKVLLTNVNPSGNFDKFTKNVRVTYDSGSYSTPNKVDKDKIDRGIYLAVIRDDSLSNSDKIKNIKKN
jgi:hypothetical protein